jgi:hypothetical protein
MLSQALYLGDLQLTPSQTFSPASPQLPDA